VAASEERTLVARNVLSSYALRSGLVLSVLLLTPYLFRKLGVDGFGTWSVMFTVTTLFGIFEYGFASGITKYVAELRARGETRRLEVIIGAGVVLMALAGVIALCACIAVGSFADGLAAGDDRDSFQTGMFVLGAAMFVRMTCGAYGAALAGFQRFDLANGAEVLAVVGFPLGCVAALESGGDVLSVAIAFGIANAATGLSLALLLHSTERGLSLRPRLSAGTGRMLAGFGSFALLTEGMRFIAVRMDTIVIAAIRSAAAAAPFAAAVKLQSGVQALTSPFAVVLMPMTSDLWARGRRDVVTRRFFLATRAVLQATLPVAAGFALFAGDLVEVWLGAGAPEVTASIIIVLMVVQIIALSGMPAESVLIGIGRVRTVSLIALVQGISNLSLSIFLVSRYGAIGAALGTLFTTALLSQARFPIVSRAIGTSIPMLLRRSMAPALVSALPALALMTVFRVVLPEGLGRLVLGLGGGIAVAALIGLWQIGPSRLGDVLRSSLGSISREPPEEQLAVESVRAEP
jgi:O-antigen/teichoic acid export membrane protein